MNCTHRCQTCFLEPVTWPHCHASFKGGGRRGSSNKWLPITRPTWRHCMALSVALLTNNMISVILSDSILYSYHLNFRNDPYLRKRDILHEQKSAHVSYSDAFSRVSGWPLLLANDDLVARKPRLGLAVGTPLNQSVSLLCPSLFWLCKSFSAILFTRDQDEKERLWCDLSDHLAAASQIWAASVLSILH